MPSTSQATMNWNGYQILSFGSNRMYLRIYWSWPLSIWWFNTSFTAEWTQPHICWFSELHSKMKFPAHSSEQDHWPKPSSCTPHSPIPMIMGVFSLQHDFTKFTQLTFHPYGLINLLPYRNVTFMPYTPKGIGSNCHGYFLFLYPNYHLNNLLYINSFPCPVQLDCLIYYRTEMLCSNLTLLITDKLLTIVVILL